jgi:copper homeostasis protein CutC
VPECASISKDRAAFIVRSMQDPRLTEMLINAYYAEEKLDRSARKCREGGLNLTSLNMLADAIYLMKSMHINYINAQDEIFTLRRSLETSTSEAIRRSITEKIKSQTRKMIDSYKEIGEQIEVTIKILSNATQDEENWKELAQSNAESLEVKKQVAQVEAIRKDNVPKDEVLKSFQALQSNRQLN